MGPYTLTGQFFEKPTRVSQVADWITRGLDDSRTSQLAEMFDAKFRVNNRSKCDVSVGELIGLVLELTNQRLD